MDGFGDKVAFLWSVADILRGDYKQSEYGRVILPFTVLRRLDTVLEPTKAAVLQAAAEFEGAAPTVRDAMLLQATGGLRFYNTSPLTFPTLLDDPSNIADNLRAYLAGFSPEARDVLEQFRFDGQIDRLQRAGSLYLVVQRFCEVDLHPDRVPNTAMGGIFEELIRKFAEQSNETAGEHFTPREVIRLMIELLFVEDHDDLAKGALRSMYDPGCGTGGMLSVAKEYLAERFPAAELMTYGQEMNPESYAICKADMMLKGDDPRNVRFGNSFTEDQFPNERYDYLIMNPPFGVSWQKSAAVIEREHRELGHAGRFGPGLPRKSDGALLFLLHMLSKMKRPQDGGSRLAIVFNGSPLFTGAAESGESEIRRYLLEHDLLEAIVALPDQMFYNTGIATYVWVVTNRKPAARKGTVQLINAVDLYQKMRKSLGDKRKELSNDHIKQIITLFTTPGGVTVSEAERADVTVSEGEARAERPLTKTFRNEDFGFHRITVERPLRLRFQLTDDAIARLEEQSAWTKLVTSKKKDPTARQADIDEGQALQTDILDVLTSLGDERVWMCRKAFLTDLKAAAKKAGLKLPAPITKAIVAAIGERDEDAKVCVGKNGKPEPDTDLRDYENVPLTEDIDAYMKREVRPHVPDAWVDHERTKVGYEIPFTRHFYVYEPPRPLDEIEGEIKALEAEIHGLLGVTFS